MKKTKLIIVLLLILISIMSITACKNKDFKISFIVDDELYRTISTKGNASISMPDAPSKEGFIFGGWFLDKGVWKKAFTADSLFDGSLIGNLTVYAKWLPRDENTQTPDSDFLGKLWEEKSELFFEIWGDIIEEGLTSLFDSTKLSHGRYEDLSISEGLMYGELLAAFTVKEDKSPAEAISMLGNILKRDDMETFGYYQYSDTNLIICDALSLDSILTQFIIKIDEAYIASDRLIRYRGEAESYTVPDGVTYIGSYAFLNRSRLTDINMPFGVTRIGDYAFSNCGGLASITIGDGVTSIGASAFYGCGGLSSITIGDGVASIGAEAFAETAWYNNQPDGLVYAGKTAYKYKGTMPADTTINLEEETKSISGYAFSGCSGLSSITIPVGVVTIGSYAFRGCGGLESITVSVENTVYKSEGNCLIERDSNTLILGCKNSVIPDSLTSIGDSAFEYFYGLNSITIPSGVTEIGSFAFSRCNGLSSVTIPDGVTRIGMGAFSYCGGLTSITIPDSVTSVGSNVFEGCVGLTSVTIGSGVTSIGYYAFSGCIGLTSAVIPDSVTSIGDYAFFGCGGLTSVTIGSGVTSIGNYAFAGCSGLTSAVIPDSVTSIGDYAFLDCGGLTSVNIPDSVTSIGSGAFAGCGGLTSITIGSGVSSIGSGAFIGCEGLTSITIGSGVTSIGSGAFDYCSNLTSITFNDTTTWYRTSSNKYTDGIKTEVSNPSKNAAYFKSTYRNYFWYKE